MANLPTTPWGVPGQSSFGSARNADTSARLVAYMHAADVTFIIGSNLNAFPRSDHGKNMAHDGLPCIIRLYTVDQSTPTNPINQLAHIENAHSIDSENEFQSPIEYPL